MSYHLKVTCKYCGDKFLAQRKSAKFCPDKQCRVKYHRRKIDSIERPYEQAVDAIVKLGRMIEGNHSYAAIAHLKSLREHINFHDVANASTWWRCQKCWKAVKKTMPDIEGCSEGGNHDWHYQKVLL